MKKLSLMLLLTLPMFTSAVDLEYTVCQVGVEGVDDVYLLPCEPHVSQQNCPTGTWLHWKLDTPAGKGKLANATTALVSGKKIIVRTMGCSNNVDFAYMVRLIK